MYVCMYIYIYIYIYYVFMWEGLRRSAVWVGAGARVTEFKHVFIRLPLLISTISCVISNA